MSFETLLRHLIDIQVLSEGSEDATGHKTQTWASYKYNVRCSVQPRRRTYEEYFTQDTGITEVGRHSVFMLYGEIPDVNDAAVRYRMKNWRNADGTVIDAGVFDIRAVRDGAGQGRILEISVMRQPQ